VRRALAQTAARLPLIAARPKPVPKGFVKGSSRHLMLVGPITNALLMKPVKGRLFALVTLNASYPTNWVNVRRRRQAAILRRLVVMRKLASQTAREPLVPVKPLNIRKRVPRQDSCKVAKGLTNAMANLLSARLLAGQSPTPNPALKEPNAKRARRLAMLLVWLGPLVIQHVERTKSVPRVLRGIQSAPAWMATQRTNKGFAKK
jgi:hypothetical protein